MTARGYKLDEAALEAAVEAHYEPFDSGDAVGAMRAAITTYLAAAPQPEPLTNLSEKNGFAKGKTGEDGAATSDTAEMPPSHTAMQRALDAMRAVAPQSAMPTARALSIVAAICERSFHAMGVAALVEELQAVSLAEMLEAKRQVKAENGKPPIDGKQTVYVVPDDRLIAAAYALANYEPSHGAVVSEPDGDGLVKALAIVRLTAAPPQEGDYV